MKGRTKLNWVAEFGYLTCQTKIGLMGVYPIGEHFYWQCAAPGIAYEGSGLRDDLTQEQCVERAEQWYYDATHEYPDDGYVKLEPGQVVVQAEDVKELLHLWISHGPRFAEINRVMRAFAGAVALVECPICQGSGVIRVPHPMKPHVPDYIDNCDNCKGTGFVSAALDASNKE